MHYTSTTCKDRAGLFDFLIVFNFLITLNILHVSKLPKIKLKNSLKAKTVTISVMHVSKPLRIKLENSLGTKMH